MEELSRLRQEMLANVAPPEAIDTAHQDDGIQPGGKRTPPPHQQSGNPLAPPIPAQAASAAPRGVSTRPVTVTELADLNLARLTTLGSELAKAGPGLADGGRPLSFAERMSRDQDEEELVTSMQILMESVRDILYLAPPAMQRTLLRQTFAEFEAELYSDAEPRKVGLA